MISFLINQDWHLYREFLCQINIQNICRFDQEIVNAPAQIWNNQKYGCASPEFSASQKQYNNNSNLQKRPTLDFDVLPKVSFHLLGLIRRRQSLRCGLPPKNAKKTS
jgi:hypothetical protein